MSWITPHSFFSLEWDEWASIIAILGAIIIILRWLLTRADKELFDPIRHQLQGVNESLREFYNRQSEVEIRLEEDDKEFIHHDERLKDHERRITSLEEEHRK
ncbi:hypothetical protein [Limosilactobacillus reuteri]|uniref:hypothetical protein n=1 Tax=Limosilactobacillus reuteri TaxID=1598 RepID=UPI00146F5D50|nr:hypothetical protein [Limosilactobacillus reuteri]NMV61380.1 hypothetical protein [Limosilactobacillus reuteri]